MNEILIPISIMSAILGVGVGVGLAGAYFIG